MPCLNIRKMRNQIKELVNIQEIEKDKVMALICEKSFPKNEVITPITPAMENLGRRISMSLSQTSTT